MVIPFVEMGQALVTMIIFSFLFFMFPIYG